MHQVLLLWESQYLATHLIGSGARIFWQQSRAEFHLFCKCLFECLILTFFSQNNTHNLLLINFQTLCVLNYCSTSWLSFSIIFISVVFSLVKLLPFQLLLSFNWDFIVLYSKFSVKFPHSPILHYTFSSWREKTMTKTINRKTCFYNSMGLCGNFTKCSRSDLLLASLPFLKCCWSGMTALGKIDQCYWNCTIWLL